MNCSVRLKTMEMDLALLLQAGVATRHFYQNQQQQQQQQMQQHHSTTITNANATSAAIAGNHAGTGANVASSLRDINNALSLTTSQQQQQQQYNNDHNNMSSGNYNISAQFQGGTSPIPTNDMLRATSPLTIGSATTTTDPTLYLRASSVSLQSQATITGIASSGNSGGGGIGAIGGGIHRQHQLQFVDTNASQTNTTPRAVDNQYSFV